MLIVDNMYLLTQYVYYSSVSLLMNVYAKPYLYFEDTNVENYLFFSYKKLKVNDFLMGH